MKKGDGVCMTVYTIGGSRRAESNDRPRLSRQTIQQGKTERGEKTDGQKTLGTSHQGIRLFRHDAVRI
jgi:hypothetical protein